MFLRRSPRKTQVPMRTPSAAATELDTVYPVQIDIHVDGTGFVPGSHPNAAGDNEENDPFFPRTSYQSSSAPFRLSPPRNSSPGPSPIRGSGVVATTLESSPAPASSASASVASGSTPALATSTKKKRLRCRRKMRDRRQQEAQKAAIVENGDGSRVGALGGETHYHVHIRQVINYNAYI